MFKKKLIALGLSLAMIGSLVACGNEPSNGGSTTATPTPATNNNQPQGNDSKEMQNASDDHSAVSADCIVGFEDDNASFATYNDADWTGDKEGTVSIGSKYDSKVLLVTRPNGGTPAVAIDVISLLGDNASKCTKVTLDIGVDCAGDFAAMSGSVNLFAGESNLECSTSWSIYKADAAMKTVTIELGDNVLTPGATNYLTFSDITDAATTPSSLIIDNIIFYDADGNALPVNTAVEFAVDGVGTYDWSNGVKQPTDEVLILTGVQTGTGWWPDNSNAFTFSQNDSVLYVDPSTTSFGPGDVLTIYYSVVDGVENVDSPYQQFPYIRMQNWNNFDEEGNEITLPDWPTNVIVDVSWCGDYLGNDNFSMDPTQEFRYDNAAQLDINLDEEDRTPSETVMINDSYTIVQYPYEYIVECVKGAGLFTDGEYTADDWELFADFIGIADRGVAVKINAVTFGKAAE